MPPLKGVAFLSLFTGCLISSAAGIDRGQFENVPEHIRDWFKSVRNSDGVSCCDVADGHRTQYDMRGNHYWVLVDGEWYEVPHEVVIHNTHNPIGEGVVWYTWLEPAKTVNPPRRLHIRCFVPAEDF